MNQIFSIFLLACVVLTLVLVDIPVSLPTNAETKENAKLSLKDFLKRDFDYDLKILGGFGQSASDPIVVMASNAADAALTEMLVLRGIGKGRPGIFVSLKMPSNMLLLFPVVRSSVSRTCPKPYTPKMASFKFQEV